MIKENINIFDNTEYIDWLTCYVNNFTRVYSTSTSNNKDNLEKLDKIKIFYEKIKKYAEENNIEITKEDEYEIIKIKYGLYSFLLKKITYPRTIYYIEKINYNNSYIDLKKVLKQDIEKYKDNLITFKERQISRR